MSADKLHAEADRWLRQAEDDLDAAEQLFRLGKLPQAGFYAQQAGEKALKALVIAGDGDPWGHSIAKLIDELEPPAHPVLEPLRELALGLDKLYIPTRYPDAVPDLIPAEAFGRAEIARALGDARAILGAVRDQIRP